MVTSKANPSRQKNITEEYYRRSQVMRTNDTQTHIGPEMGHFARLRFFSKTPNFHVPLGPFDCSFFYL